MTLTDFFTLHKGELAGLGAAASWALSSLLFSRVPAQAGPIADEQVGARASPVVDVLSAVMVQSMSIASP